MKHTEKRCPNCGQALRFVGSLEQLTRKSQVVLGALIFECSNSPVYPGAWVCPDCGKLELYLTEPERQEPEEAGLIAQVKCPYCGFRHDMDDPKCPLCGHRLDVGEWED